MKLLHDKRIVAFVIATYAVYAIGCTIAAFFVEDLGVSQQAILMVAGWTPAILTVVFRLVFDEGFADTGWGLVPENPAWVVLALLPVIVFLTACFAVDLQGEPTFDLPADALVGIGLNLLLNTLFVFGEEFAWRGYLQSRVIDRIGVWKGLLVMSVIWAYWHIPLDLMGYGYPGYDPALAAFVLRPLALLGTGMIVGLIYYKTQSVWYACLAHGANNMMGGRIGEFFEFTAAQSKHLLLWVTAVNAVVGLALLVFVWRSEEDG
jgi:membrane protease YdiL (CAAX protease family)